MDERTKTTASSAIGHILKRPFPISGSHAAAQEGTQALIGRHQGRSALIGPAQRWLTLSVGSTG
jgi:hypothetical protein